MDEPCSALDPISTLAIEDLIEELKETFTIVIVTHNMQQAARVSDQTAFFNIAGTGKPGKLIEIGRHREDLLRPPTSRPPRTTSPAGSAESPLLGVELRRWRDPAGRACRELCRSSLHHAGTVPVIHVRSMTQAVRSRPLRRVGTGCLDSCREQRRMVSGSGWTAGYVPLLDGFVLVRGDHEQPHPGSPTGRDPRTTPSGRPAAVEPQPAEGVPDQVVARHRRDRGGAGGAGLLGHPRPRRNPGHRAVPWLQPDTERLPETGGHHRQPQGGPQRRTGARRRPVVSDARQPMECAGARGPRAVRPRRLVADRHNRTQLQQ